MPLPLLPVLLRIGALAAAGYGVTRWLAARSGEGRRDQRAEDALDDLEEGLLLHRLRPEQLGPDQLRPEQLRPGQLGPGQAQFADQTPDQTPNRIPPQQQRNATLRFRRIIGFRGREWEIDAGLIARLRLRERRSGQQ